jgi:hypothetical protein
MRGRVAFSLSEFIRLRPFAYHLTDRANISALVACLVLEPAADLLHRAGEASLLRQRRAQEMPIWVDGRKVVLKDQRPLTFANAELAPGWEPGDLVEHLNRHVFFWPGGDRGPLKYGERLFEAYEASSTSVLRVATAELFALNPDREPLFCPFNSGAPRMQAGRRVARGPDLFTPASAFPRRASEVVELVFNGPVMLPASTQMRRADGEWAELRATAI